MTTPRLRGHWRKLGNNRWGVVLDSGRFPAVLPVAVCVKSSRTGDRDVQVVEARFDARHGLVEAAIARTGLAYEVLDHPIGPVITGTAGADTVLAAVRDVLPVRLDRQVPETEDFAEPTR